MKLFNKNNYIYTPLFCEENIWYLAQSLINNGMNDEDIDVLFLTNRSKKIVIFNQLSAELGEPIIWDYHVILRVKLDDKHYIFDFDSRLEFPCQLDEYLIKSLPNNIPEDYRSMLRAIPSKIYLDCFESDRSHMLGVIPPSQFPNYPIIISSAKQKIKLHELFDSNQQ